MSPKRTASDRYTIPATELLDRFGLLADRAFVREFVTPDGVDFEHLAAALAGDDEAEHTARITVLSWTEELSGAVRFAADLGLDRWGSGGWSPATASAALAALEDATRARRSGGVVNTLNGRVGAGATFIQAGNVTGPLHL